MDNRNGASAAYVNLLQCDGKKCRAAAIGVKGKAAIGKSRAGK